MSPLVEGFNNLCTATEKTFNFAGSLPFIGAISGELRVVAGSIQHIAGLAFMLLGGLVYASCCLADHHGSMRQAGKAIAILGAEHAIHGILNIFRGAFEVALCETTEGFGNIILFVPNFFQSDKFAPLFRYGSFTDNRQVQYVRAV